MARMGKSGAVGIGTFVEERKWAADKENSQRCKKDKKRSVVN